MRRWAHRAGGLAVIAAAAALAGAAAGCGSAPPREADIYHDPALRPGVVPARAEPETELLARLAGADEAQTITVAGQQFEVEAPYPAASGRWCRTVRTGSRSPRLACEADGGWVFVPHVIPPTALEPAP